jgi:hypothetical protein
MATAKEPRFSYHNTDTILTHHLAPCDFPWSMGKPGGGASRTVRR